MAVEAEVAELTLQMSTLLSSATGADVEKAIADLKEAISSDDAERIKSSTTALAQAAMKIGEAIYASQQGAGGDGDASDGDSSSGAVDDNVVDADFEEVKDDKKKSA